MSRSTSLSVIFEAELAAARSQWQAFVQEVEGRPLRVSFEGSPSVAGAQPPRTFSGATAVPPGGVSVALPQASPQAVSSGAPAPTPIGLGTADPVASQRLMDQINSLRAQIPGARGEGVNMLQTAIRGFEQQYIRRFGSLPPTVTARESMGDPGPTMFGQDIAGGIGISSSSFERQQGAPGIPGFEGTRISGRTRLRFYSSEGGGERPMRVTGTGEAELEAHGRKFSPDQGRLEGAVNDLVQSIQREAAAHSAAADAARRRSDRVDRSWNQAALAQGREQEGNARRFTRSQEAAEFDAFRRSERDAARTAEEAAEEANTTRQERESFRGAYYGGRNLGGGTGYDAGGRDRGGFVGRDFGGGPEADPNSRNLGFGFIRPLAAVYFAMHAVSAAGSRILQEDAANRRMALTQTYSPLSTQVGESLADVQGAEGTFRPFMGSFFNVGRGFSPRSHTFVDRNTLGEMREVQKVQNAADAGYSAQRESRRIDAETRAIGLTGYAAELAQGREADREAFEANWIEESQHPYQPGFGLRAHAITQRAAARMESIGQRVLMQQSGMGSAALQAHEMAEGHEWSARIIEMNAQNAQQSFDLSRATTGLPLWMRTMLSQGLQGLQAEQGRSMVRENDRKVELQIFKADRAVEVSQDTRMGFTHQAMRAEVERRFFGPRRQMLDEQGNIIDPTNPQAPAQIQSRTREYNEAIQVADQHYTQQVIGIQTSTRSALLVANRNPLGAQMQELMGQFAQQVVGMNPGSPDFQLAFQQFAARSAAVQRQRADQNEMTGAGLASESRGLAAGLRRDYAGQQLEEMAGQFEQRQLSLRDKDQGQLRIDTLKNEVAAIQLFQQRYEDSFRGQALDTRLFSLQNPRDTEDPAKVMEEIADKLQQVLQILSELTSE